MLGCGPVFCGTILSQPLTDHSLYAMMPCMHAHTSTPTAYLPLADLVDAAKEKERLSKQADKLIKEIEVRVT